MSFLAEKNHASEEETRFIINTVEKFTPDIILTLHAPFKVVNYDGDGKNIAEEISDIIRYPVEANIGILPGKLWYMGGS